MTPDAATIACRFVHYLSTMILFGIALFPLCVSRGGGSGEASWAAARLWAALAVAALLAMASGIALLVCVAAVMAGSWSDLDADALVNVATGTGFGRIWAVRLALAAALTALCLHRRRGPWKSTALVVLSAALLGSIAGTGHAQDGAGAIRVVHVAADALHLLAAGAWLGGIVALFVMLTATVRAPCASAISGAVEASIRFSGLGYVAVATLVATGLVNSWLLVGSPHALASTGYGRLLCVKLALFAAMLLLAASNRFSIVPELLRQATAGGTRAPLARLKRHVAGEQLLGAAVIFAVGVLGTMEPAIDIAAS